MEMLVYISILGIVWAGFIILAYSLGKREGYNILENDREWIEIEQERLERLLENIDNYDGSGNGQKNI